MEILDEGAEILPWVDAAEFGGLHQGKEDSVGFSAALGVSALPGLAADNRASELAFLCVVVDGHIAIRDKVR